MTNIVGVSNAKRVDQLKQTTAVTADRTIETEIYVPEPVKLQL